MSATSSSSVKSEEDKMQSNVTSRGQIWTQKDDIVFPYVLEDADAEARCIDEWAKEHPGKNARVLQVASAGDTAIALAAHPSVSAVDAIDLNVAQIHCSHLKLAAYIHLTSTADLIRFFANENAALTADASTQAFRESVYQSISSHLPPDTHQFWSSEPAHTLLIVNSLYSSGFRQRDLPQLNASLLSANLHPYLSSSSSSSPASPSSIESHKSEWDSIWSSSFKVAPGGRLGNMVFHSLINLKEYDNWFIRSFFGIWTVENGKLPRFLDIHHTQFQNKTIEKQELKKKITFTYREMNEYLIDCEKDSRTFDFVHVSTVLDGLTAEYREKLLTSLKRSLPIGSVLLFRTGPFPMELNNSQPSGLRKLVSQYFEVNHELSDELKKSEKCHIYFDVVVATKRKD